MSLASILKDGGGGDPIENTFRDARKIFKEIYRRDMSNALSTLRKSGRGYEIKAIDSADLKNLESVPDNVIYAAMSKDDPMPTLVHTRDELDKFKSFMKPQQLTYNTVSENFENSCHYAAAAQLLARIPELDLDDNFVFDATAEQIEVGKAVLALKLELGKKQSTQKIIRRESRLQFSLSFEENVVKVDETIRELSNSKKEFDIQDPILHLEFLGQIDENMRKICGIQKTFSTRCNNEHEVPSQKDTVISADFDVENDIIHRDFMQTIFNTLCNGFSYIQEKYTPCFPDVVYNPNIPEWFSAVLTYKFTPSGRYFIYRHNYRKVDNRAESIDPMNLKLEDTITNPENGVEFTLLGCILRKTSKVHFTFAEPRSSMSGRRWVEFDDLNARITEITEDLVEQECYIILYGANSRQEVFTQ